ncbi:MAG TPA: hypothetical protein DIT25_02760 [Candidatus Moranbacteria bacterium]|nr:hypothetical protein [Candidatus Moranbacteria bacterium]
MENVQDWGNAIASSFLEAWQKFISFIPDLVAAILVFLVGWIIASAIAALIRKVIEVLKVDEGLEKIGIFHVKERDRRYGVAWLLAGLVKWFIILIFLMTAVNILGLTQVTDLLNRIIFYLPNVAAAVIILTVAILLGNFVYQLIHSATEKMNDAATHFLAMVAKWAIIIFGVLAALIQLQIAPSLVNALFIGIVAFAVIAGGLAFGLGGRDEAASLLKKVREGMSRK